MNMIYSNNKWQEINKVQLAVITNCDYCVFFTFLICLIFYVLSIFESGFWYTVVFISYFHIETAIMKNATWDLEE